MRGDDLEGGKPGMTRTASAAAFMLGAMLAAGIHAPAAAASQSALYRTADRNNNGTLNSGEFRTFIDLLADDGLPIAKRVRFWRVYGLAFRITDKNRDGELTPAELRSSERENRNRKRP